MAVSLYAGVSRPSGHVKDHSTTCWTPEKRRSSVPYRYRYRYRYRGSIRSRPDMYGRSASGMVTVPSAFW